MGKKDATQRLTWDRPIESFFSVIGYTIGLGNLWRFPYLCQKNGGGVFLIPYVISLVTISLPMFFFEVGLGQMTKRGRVGAWNRLPLMKGVGLASFVIGFLGLIPYMMIMAWGLLYLANTFTIGSLPWMTCGNPWNTNSCVTLQDISNSSSAFYNASRSAFRPLLKTLTRHIALKDQTVPSSLAETNYVLRIPNPESTMDGEFNWPLLCALIAAFVTVFSVTVKGIKSSGKVVYFTATYPFFMVIVLFIRGITLDGAELGIRAMLFPDITALARPQVWIEGASQALYTFGICYAALTAFGSYNKSDYNFLRMSLIAVPTTSLASLLMGFATFTVIGHMAHLQGIKIEDVIESGPGLVFQVFPVAVGLMPIPQLWAALFFIMVFFLAVDSSFGDFESLMTIIGDAYPYLISSTKRRLLANVAMGFTFFFFSMLQLHGNGIYIFELINYYGAAGICLLCVVFFESLTVGWLWDANVFGREVKNTTGVRVPMWFKICYKFIIPLITLTIFLFYCVKWKPLVVSGFVYPGWANAIGWMLSLASLSCVPAYATYTLCKGKGTLRERWAEGLKPRPSANSEELKIDEDRGAMLACDEKV